MAVEQVQAMVNTLRHRGANPSFSCGQFYVCVFQYEASTTVLYATKSMDRGSRPVRKKRTAVVEAGQDE